MSVSLDVNASHPSSECRKEKQMDKCSASLQQHCNVLQAFMSFLANDNLESCHMAFDNDDSEEEEEEKQAFTAQMSDTDQGYEMDGSNTLS